MAMFSRRKKTDPAPDDATASAERDAAVPADAAAPTSSSDAPAEADAPAVGISVSSFRGLGGVSRTPGADGPIEAEASDIPAAPSEPQTAPYRRGPAEAPPSTETIPGLRDNVLLQQALAGLSPQPSSAELVNVVRQLLQGHVFLRVLGDARALLAKGEPLPLAVVERDGKQFVLVYSGGAALQASVQAEPEIQSTAVGQPILAVLTHVLSGSYEGVIVDNASAPARAVLPRQILERAVAEADDTLRVKEILAGPRGESTAADIVSALSHARVYLAVATAEDGSVRGVAESRTPEGERYLELYSHPLELIALDRGDQALPVTLDQLAAALRSDAGLTGVILDQAGPWIRLSRGDLAPLMARAGLAADGIS